MFNIRKVDNYLMKKCMTLVNESRLSLAASMKKMNECKKKRTEEGSFSV